MEDRITYYELKAEFLDCFYSCCRSKLDTYKKTGEKWGYSGEEIAYAYYQYENAFERPIENLMLNVLTLILKAGRGLKDVESNLRKFITDILTENSLEELIKDIGEDEKKDLLYDMQLLGLIEKKSE